MESEKWKIKREDIAFGIWRDRNIKVRNYVREIRKGRKFKRLMRR